MSRRLAFMIVLVATFAIAAWALVVLVPRLMTPRPTADGGVAAPVPQAQRKITATLYYIAEDGMALVGVKREVPFAEPVSEQARHIVEAQLGAADPPLAAAVPQGTTLRGLFISERGDAFVDLSPEVGTRHTGGALDELFTVYAIVNSLTVNLPAVARVQILVNGQEVDTLAGHVDLRHPLQKSLKWIAGQ
jgi:spore germination protein GerM